MLTNVVQALQSTGLRRLEQVLALEPCRPLGQLFAQCCTRHVYMRGFPITNTLHAVVASLDPAQGSLTLSGSRGLSESRGLYV